MEDLRVRDEDDFKKESCEEDDLPEVVYFARAGVLDDQVAFAPVSLPLVVLLILGAKLVFVHLFLEEELRELLVIVAQFEIWLHVVLVQVLSEDFGVAFDALLFEGLLELALVARYARILLSFVGRTAAAAQNLA